MNRKFLSDIPEKSEHVFKQKFEGLKKENIKFGPLIRIHFDKKENINEICNSYIERKEYEKEFGTLKIELIIIGYNIQKHKDNIIQFFNIVSGYDEKKISFDKCLFNTENLYKILRIMSKMDSLREIKFVECKNLDTTISNFSSEIFFHLTPKVKNMLIKTNLKVDQLQIQKTSFVDKEKLKLNYILASKFLVPKTLILSNLMWSEKDFALFSSSLQKARIQALAIKRIKLSKTSQYLVGKILQNEEFNKLDLHCYQVEEYLHLVKKIFQAVSKNDFFVQIETGDSFFRAQQRSKLAQYLKNQSFINYNSSFMWKLGTPTLTPDPIILF
eukprot:snap_masked-scaffold_24-processed-gene-3.29-mRNA-1 protein AED:1.00 eAED:1.00 QI:0/0/0/0/1/1/2/0/328